MRCIQFIIYFSILDGYRQIFNFHKKHMSISTNNLQFPYHLCIVIMPMTEKIPVKYKSKK